MNTGESATSSINEYEGVINDESQVLPGFCQSLEAVLRQGLKIGGLGLIGLLDRDYWNCIEGLTNSSRVLIRPPPSVNHVITVVKQCKKVVTSQGRGRLFIRVALTKGILVQALEALLDNQEYVRYWYKETSALVDYRRKGVVMDILKSLKKKMYKVNVNNCSFLDETWLMPKIECYEFIPCAQLGLTLLAVDGKAVIVTVVPGSVADERDIQPGDCLDELFGQIIDEKWAIKVGQLKRKNQGKPITATVIKGRYEDGRWFPPMFTRFQTLCAAGRCRMNPPPAHQKEQEKDNMNSDHERIKSRHVFTVTYLGCANVGSNGSCIFVQDGIKKLLDSTDNMEKTHMKLELMERDIVCKYIESGEVFRRYSYTETSSCGLKDNDPNTFGFITGNTTCSFADSFDCHVFSTNDHFAAKQIIEGIGKGFDRTVYCV